MFSLRAAHIAGQSMEIKRFGVRDLLPETKHYMTYDGSTTMPACHETTTWIILNKPIYITKQQVRERDSLYDVLCACRCNFEGSIYIYTSSTPTHSSAGGKQINEAGNTPIALYTIAASRFS